jgi:urease accessory protein
MAVSVAMALAAAFGMFHGYAHGAEMPAAASAVLYGLGFVTATAILHLIGVGAGLASERLAQGAGRVALRLGGGAVAALGLALLVM